MYAWFTLSCTDHPWIMLEGMDRRMRRPPLLRTSARSTYLIQYSTLFTPTTVCIASRGAHVMQQPSIPSTPFPLKKTCQATLYPIPARSAGFGERSVAKTLRFPKEPGDCEPPEMLGVHNTCSIWPRVQLKTQPERCNKLCTASAQVVFCNYMHVFGYW